MRTWRNASGVRANMYTQHEISTEEHLAWWQRTCQNAGHQYFMYVYNTAPTGIASLNGIDRDSLCSSWAFYVSPDAPRGSGSRLEFLMLDHAFATLGLNKLHCEVLAFNTAVIKMHQKFGFREEGIFRHQYKNGDRFVDIHRLGILAEEWNAMRQDMHERLLSYERK
jgi:UDP-4-amino-4,6-dideoxy-N-acetyl-beta-L-altrosamine N-acetyltransferase